MTKEKIEDELMEHRWDQVGRLQSDQQQQNTQTEKRVNRDREFVSMCRPSRK